MASVEAIRTILKERSNRVTARPSYLDAGIGGVLKCTDIAVYRNHSRSRTTLNLRCLKVATSRRVYQSEYRDFTVDIVVIVTSVFVLELQVFEITAFFMVDSI
jgi:hypothetical protein